MTTITHVATATKPSGFRMEVARSTPSNEYHVGVFNSTGLEIANNCFRPEVKLSEISDFFDKSVNNLGK